jgi:predicted nucleic acid-binding protein
LLTLDANVFVAAKIRSEPDHDAARRVISIAVEQGLRLHLPWLTVVEASVAIGRRLGDADPAARLAAELADMPGASFHPLDRSLALLAAALGAECRLRGADAVYAAVARRHGTCLITCDDELRRRTVGVIEAQTPKAWLRKQP